MPLSTKISQYFRKNNHIIIHYHIFKNAGATVDAILRNNFGEACAEFEGSDLAAVVRPESLLKYILENPHLKVISSHNARLPVPKHLRLTFYPLIFLRHPIDRIGSMYSFERRQPAGITFTADFARENSFAEYVRYFLQESIFFLKNFQTLYFCSKELDDDSMESIAVSADLDIAIERLRRLAFFGIVESFDQSLFLMQEYLEKRFGTFDINYSIVNKSPERKSTLETRLDEIKSELGTDLYHELVENNLLDLKLYETATQLFNKKIVRKEQHQSAPEM